MRKLLYRNFICFSYIYKYFQIYSCKFQYGLSLSWSTEMCLEYNIFLLLFVLEQLIL